ncbi:MAG: hypothetical protein ACRD8W_25820, partial [Nitrososphaeraceae archaeon]
SQDEANDTFFEAAIRESNDTNQNITKSDQRIGQTNQSILTNATNATNASLLQQEQQSPSGNILPYENASFGFTIEYPNDWLIVNEYKRNPSFENLQLGMLLFFLPQGILSSDHNSTFWIETEFLPNRFMPLDRFVDSEIEGLYNGQAEIISRGPINIGGEAAEKVELLCCDSTESLHQVRIFLTKGELGYTLVYSAAPPSLYLLFLNDADDVVKSFRFLNGSNIVSEGNRTG